MSYVRWSKDCEVYVFWHVDKDLVCHDCCLGEGDFVAGEDAQKMVEHMKAHRAAGGKVPDYMIDAFVEIVAMEGK